jgi:hypothetical protein
VNAKKKKKGKRVSVYLPAELVEALIDKPGVNVSRLCREALEWRMDNEGTDSVIEHGTSLQRLAKLEQRERHLTGVMESIARQACHHAGISPVSEADVLRMEEHIAKLDARIATLNREKSQLVGRIKVLEEALGDKLAAEAAIEALNNPQDALLPYPTNPVGSLVPLKGGGAMRVEAVEPPPEGDCTAGCGSSADTYCKSCHKPLCWTCWTGDTGFGEEPRGLCPECLSAAPEPAQDVSSSGGPAPEGEPPSGPEEPPEGSEEPSSSSPVASPPPKTPPEAVSDGETTKGITDAG